MLLFSVMGFAQRTMFWAQQGISGIPALAQLPLVWADDHECPASNGTFDVVKHIPGDYTTGNAQQAWVDWQTDGVNDSWHVIVTHANTTAPLTALAKLVGGVMTTKCIVWDSDTPLTAGVTVCSHGVQDNVASSTDIGIRNPDCNGSGMSYQLAQSLTSISPGSFTLANGTNTNTSAYNDVVSMFTIECNTSNCAALSTGAVDANGNGPNHFAIYNAEIRINSGQTCCFNVDMENAGVTTASLPSHYHLDRVWMHGNATDAGSGSQTLTDNARMNCGGNCTLSNSQTSKSIRPGAESHSIYYADAGQLKIVHNWIEGSSIGIFDGGISSSVPGGVSGRDLEIRRNRLTYPFPWLGNGAGGGVCGASSCVRKNCFEHKGVQRILFDGNICENVDNSGGQNGTITDFNNRACTPSACDNYTQTIQNVTATNDIYRHGCGGMVFDANSGNIGASGNSASTPGRNVFLQNDLLYDISLTNFGCGVTSNGTFYLGVTNHNFTVSSVTRNAGGTISTVVLAGGTGENQTGLVAGDPILMSGCTDTSFNAGPYPFVLASTVSGTTITYANTGTANATSAGCTFNNGMGWPNFVTLNHITAVADDANYMGTNGTLINATFPRNMTFSNSIFTGTGGLGTPGNVDGTNFTSQWFDFTTLLTHHTVFSQRVATTWAATTAYKLGQVVTPSGNPAHFYTAVTSGASGGSQPAFSGGQRSCVTDGTVTWQENGLRVGTTGGLPNYTEYRVLNTPISPPTTLFFPMTDFTYGATADSTSIGFKGALNAPTSGSNTCTGGTQVTGINIALDLSDWHNYALDSSSSYKASASDGTALGASIPLIDAAQTSTKYVCQSPCGTGPTTD
jgi:hypothetical protein